MRNICRYFVCALALSCGGQVKTPDDEGSGGRRRHGPEKAPWQRSIEQLSNALVASYRGPEKPRLAVLDIVHPAGRNRSCSAGRSVAESLTNDIFASGKFELIERSQISQLLSNLKGDDDPSKNQETAARIGHLLGASVLVVGTLSRSGSAYSANARIVNAESGLMLATGESEFRRIDIDRNGGCD
jgi:TolB-like protein